MDVSIVIVNYNTKNLIKECVDSIRSNTTSICEIIIVDNASTDGSAEYIEDTIQGITLLKNVQNGGFAKANNQGFYSARGRYFLMLNPDTIVLDNAIDKVVKYMDQHEDVAVCGPRNISKNYELQRNCDHFPGIWNDISDYLGMGRFSRHKIFNKKHMRYWDYSDIRDVDKITGCSIVIRADVYKQLNGMDEKYFMYFEETDLCYRIRKNGHRIVYYPQAQIIHFGGESSKNGVADVFYKTAMIYFLPSKYYFFMKNYGTVQAAAIRTIDCSYGLMLMLKSVLRKNDISRKLGVSLVKYALSPRVVQPGL